MNDDIRRTLARGNTIDITTTGCRTGLPRRIEIVYHNIDGRLFISGIPNARRKRAWLTNLEKHPAFTFHLKGPLEADLPATARVITDDAERRAILPHVARAWRRNDLEDMVSWSPLIEVTIPGLTEPQAHAA